VNLSALWNDEATEEEVINCYQELVDTGMAWQLEGYVGRTAMSLIDLSRVCRFRENELKYVGHGIEIDLKGELTFVELSDGYWAGRIVKQGITGYGTTKKGAKEKVLRMLESLVYYLKDFPEALDKRMDRNQMTWKRTEGPKG